MFNLKSICDFKTSKSYRIGLIDALMAEKGFTFLGEGRHRRTYLSPNKRFVLKFPHCKEGLTANRNESDTWKKHLGKPDLDGTEYAPCRLIQGKIIMMAAMVEVYGGTEGCDYARDIGAVKGEDKFYCDDDLPSWAKDIDACQVGMSASGKLVAYDYANV